MRILILGGTQFLGRHLVDAAQARGHTITLFNRGKSNPDLYPDVEHLHGDRDGNLTALHGRSWDSVIDTSGMIPRLVRDSATLLAAQVGHYTFISTRSVYADFSKAGMNENTTLAKIADETVETVTGETYGALKVLCEQAAEHAMPGRVLIIRPGLIVGPYDVSDRFTYWPHRIALGGEVLAPGRRDGRISLIDVRDLAEWTIRLVEAKQIGIVDAQGPDYPLTMEALLDACKTISGSNATFTWVDEKFLLDHDATPWMELPLWIPDSENWPGFHDSDIRKALSMGLTFRPLAETIRATLVWDATRGVTALKAGLSAEKETNLLRQWLEHAKLKS